jgi:hypothetical protein
VADGKYKHFTIFILYLSFASLVLTFKIGGGINEE